jgi:hypothetical protein
MFHRFLILLLTLLWFSTAVLAEDDNEQNNTMIKEQKPEHSKTNSKISVSKRAQVKTLEEFIPSEEISADKPVAFPNDI